MDGLRGSPTRALLGEDGLSRETRAFRTPELSPPAVDAPASHETLDASMGGKIMPRLESRRLTRAAVGKKRKQAKAGKKQYSLLRPLSELAAASMSGEMIKAVEAFVNRDESARLIERTRNGKVKRPLNDFVLYRKAYSSVAKEEVIPAKNKNNQQVVSQVCGESWGMEKPAVKAMFKGLANTERKKHLAAFPDYKYAPKSGKKPKEAGDRHRREKKASATSGVALIPDANGHPSNSRSAYGRGPGQWSYELQPDPMGIPRGATLYDPPPNMPFWCPSGIMLEPDQPSYYQDISTVSEPVYENVPIIKEEIPPGGGGNFAAQTHRPPHDAELCLDFSAIGPGLCIDPLLLPRTGRPTYQYLVSPGWAHDYQDGAFQGNMMAAMPALDVDGTHNAYLRGSVHDWQVEPFSQLGDSFITPGEHE
ncbi:hypothetical protein RJ55_06836 [Drechmeria coniospora]|nr:hypothetical protein RJ55_06836 [Drechmeria coniospora]